MTLADIKRIINHQIKTLKGKTDVSGFQLNRVLNSLSDFANSGGGANFYNSDGISSGNRTFNGGGFDLTYNNLQNYSVLTTGPVSFVSAGNNNFQATGTGNVFISTDLGGNVNIQGLKYPKFDGLLGHVLTTDGAGNLTFQVADVSSVAETYTPTNVSTDRAYDANSTTLDEIADVLGTLIADLKTSGIIQ